MLLLGALLAGCASGLSDIHSSSRVQMVIGHVKPLGEVLVREPGGDSMDFWTAYSLEASGQNSTPSVVLGYEDICAPLADARVKYLLRLQLRAAVVMRQDEGELKNEWFIISCKVAQDEA